MHTKTLSPKVKEWQLLEGSATRLLFFSTAKIILFRINHNFLLSMDKEIFLDRVARASEDRVETLLSMEPTATTSPSVWATNKASTSTQSKVTQELT